MSSQNSAGCVWRLTKMGENGRVPITELHVPPTALHLQTTELFLSHHIMAWVLSLIYHRGSLWSVALTQGILLSVSSMRNVHVMGVACDYISACLEWSGEGRHCVQLFCLFYNLLADICVQYIPAVLWLLWDITMFLSVSVSVSPSLPLSLIYIIQI